MNTTTELSNLQQLRLAEALKESGMMQKDLAALLGYTPAGLNRIFKGKVSLERKTAQLIGRALSVRPEWLLCEDNIKVPVHRRWMDNRYENLYHSFHLAGYEIEQIEGGTYDYYRGIPDGDAKFLIHTRDGSQHYRATYAEITRLLNSIEATERALVQSFARTSCPVDPAELERIRNERRAADLAAFDDEYEETDK